MPFSRRRRPAIGEGGGRAPELFLSIVHGLPVGVLVVDRAGRAEFANDLLPSLLGHDDWRGIGWQRAWDPRTVADLMADIRFGRDHRVDVVVPAEGATARTLDVHAVARHDGARPFWILTVADVTDERAHTARLVDQATHDAMTGLYNRSQFLEFVAHALDRRRRDPQGVAAVLFIDVDNLKATNDAAGHEAGDQLLRDVAERISSAVRPADIVARYGGDEFAVLCEDLLERAEGEDIAARVIAAVNDHGGRGRSATVSVGCAIADDTEVEPAAVVRSADLAMYRARAGGRSPGGVGRGGATVGQLSEVDQVLAGAAHELRTPLTTIIGYAATLRIDGDKIPAEAKTAAAAAIERQAGRLAAMLDGLLDIGRLRGGAQVDAHPVDLVVVVADALEAAPAPEGVTVRNGLDGGPAMVRGDDNDLTRVVVNLLTNSYRHGGRNVEVWAQQEEDHVVLSVADDGPGVPDELVRRLFEPFVRGSAGRGAGLGLALAGAIAKANGGSLAYRSVTPNGACFRLSLPVFPDEPERWKAVPA